MKMRESLEEEIRREDIDQLVEDLPAGDAAGRRYVHVLPQEYIVDNEAGHPQSHPACQGIRFGGQLPIISGQVTAARNIYPVHAQGRSGRRRTDAGTARLGRGRAEPGGRRRPGRGAGGHRRWQSPTSRSSPVRQHHPAHRGHPLRRQRGHRGHPPGLRISATRPSCSR